MILRLVLQQFLVYLEYKMNIHGFKISRPDSVMLIVRNNNILHK